MTARSASDLLLVAGRPPSTRVDGTITALPEGALDGTDIETAVLDALPVGAARRYQQGDPADASLAVAGLGRFRINLHRERGRAAAAVRALPARPPRLSGLGLSPNVERLTSLPFGLVLIGGPTGSTAAHSEKPSATPAPGDHPHAPQWIVHARGVARPARTAGTTGTTRSAGPHRPPRRARPVAPRHTRDHPRPHRGRPLVSRLRRAPRGENRTGARARDNARPAATEWGFRGPREVAAWGSGRSPV